MKTWWLKLYTLPSLRKFAEWLGLWLVADLVVLKFMPLMSEQLFFPFVGIVGFLTLFHSHEFFMNFDFHKNTIGYRELQKIAFKEVFISYLARLLIGLMIAFISFSYGGAGKWLVQGLQMLGTFSQLLLFTSIGFICVAYFRLKRAGLHQKKTAGLPSLHKNFFLNLLYTTVVFVCYLLMCATVALYLVPTAIYTQAGGLIGASVFTGIMSFYFYSEFIQSFHYKPKPKENLSKILRSQLRMAFVVMPLSLFFVFAFWPLARLDMQLPIYTFAQKSSTFSFWGGMSPKISEEEFVAFARQSEDASDLELLYDKAPSHIRKWPLRSFIKKPSLHHALAYINKAQVGPQDLRWMANEITHEALVTQPAARDLANAIIKKWPQDEELPVAISDHLLAKRKRAIASELPQVVK